MPKKIAHPVRGADDSIKPGVERSGTPGKQTGIDISPETGGSRVIPHHLASICRASTIDFYKTQAAERTQGINILNSSTTPKNSPRSGRWHKAWGVSPRSGREKWQRARGAGDGGLESRLCSTRITTQFFRKDAKTIEKP